MNILVSQISPNTPLLWLKTRITGHRLVLISTEPEAAFPPNHGWIARTFTDAQVYLGQVAGRYPAIRYPVDFNRPQFSRSKRLARACFLASNRFSPLPSSNYELRDRIVREIEPKLLTIRGNYWDLNWWEKSQIVIKHLAVSIIAGSRISGKKAFNYIAQGKLSIDAVDDKFEFTSQYAVALVIENESTYVSEKLLEAIQAGCIPVYIGPEISEEWLPRDLYVRANPDVMSIRKALEQAIAMNLAAAQHLQKQWLSSTAAQLWSRESVRKQTHELLRKKLDATH